MGMCGSGWVFVGIDQYMWEWVGMWGSGWSGVGYVL